MLDKELRLGRIAGPFEVPPLPNFKCSPIALREKSTPGKFRLLHNLSFPYSQLSVNANIPKASSTVHYQNINDAIELVVKCSPGAFLAKCDIAEAFRIVPVHPSDYHLLGFHYDGRYYYEKMLSMGAASSCRIFETFSSGLKWILEEKFNVRGVVKVLDDFLFVSSSFEGCLRDLRVFTALCEQLGVPLAPHKTEGPCTRLTFLGIEIDARRMETRLPEDKRKKYQAEVETAMGKKSLPLRDLQSIIGRLQFATSVIPGGRAFLRRLHALTSGVQRPLRLCLLDAEAQLDLVAWRSFLINFNGVTVFPPDGGWGSAVSLSMGADASSRGYGLTLGAAWFRGMWPDSWRRLNIALLELYPFYMGISIFAQVLSNKRLVCRSDNSAVVNVLSSLSAKCPILMQIVRPLAVLLLTHNITLLPSHIPGKLNTVCDALSRLQVLPHMFLREAGLAENPVEVPQNLLPRNFALQL
ncbi:uncharacterized protein [Procambarus clarkii]|uniref:uncharacterized protein n=1 Tax=Procambarus clarkii TaxID=6728 RepID=UPI003742C924